MRRGWPAWLVAGVAALGWEALVLSGQVHEDVPGLLAATQVAGIPVTGVIPALVWPVAWPLAGGWALGLERVSVVAGLAALSPVYHGSALPAMAAVALAATATVTFAAWLGRRRATRRLAGGAAS